MLLVVVVLVHNHNFGVLKKLIGNELMFASFYNYVLYSDISGLTLLLCICWSWFFFQDYPLETNLWKHYAIIVDVDAMLIAHEVLCDPCLIVRAGYSW